MTPILLPIQHFGDKEKFEEQKNIQENYFRAHIHLAKKYNLPLIIHNRDSGNDILRVLEDE